MNEFSVTILGSSSAIPTSTRFPSSQMVTHQSKFYLVDCGEGTQIQLRKNQIRFSKIGHIFISHLHGDHFFGLIGLISSFNLLGRKTELHIYAAEKIEAVINLQLEVSLTRLNYKITYHYLQFESKQLLFENDSLEIYSFPLNHSIPTCGFLFQEKPHPRKIRKDILQKYDIPVYAFDEIKKGADFITELGEIIRNDEISKPGNPQRSYAYCSDTAFYSELTKYISNVDLLYHEASFMEDKRKIAEEKKHSTTLDAAKTAKLVNAKTLIIGHFSARYKDFDELLKEAKANFNNTLLAEENQKYFI
jgi:ribonuclease Z